MAQTYDFATSGLSVIQNPKVISTISQRVCRDHLAAIRRCIHPGLSNALTFRATASFT